MPEETEFVFDPARYTDQDDDCTYRQEFLRCLKLEKWDGGTVDAKIETLRGLVTDDDVTNLALEGVKKTSEWQRLERFLPSDESTHSEYAFRLLLSFDFFYYFMRYLGAVIEEVEPDERSKRADELLENLSA